MSLRVYKCSQCNTEFEFDSTRDALFCPLCGAAARVTSKKATGTTTSTVKPASTVNNTTTNTTTSTTSAARKQMVAVKFVDTATKTTIGTANIPTGWKYGAEIQNTFQSKEEPFVSIAQVTNTDNTVTMFVRSGENFLDVRNGIAQDEVHKDGAMDKYFNTPMRRLTAFDEYVNSLTGYFVNAKLTQVGKGTLPSYYGQNDATAKKAWQADANELAKQFNNSQLKFELASLVNESVLLQYKYTANRKTNYMLLGADVGGFEFHLTSAAQQTNANNMMGLLTSLIGGGTQTNTNSGVYINWGSKYIFGLITDEENLQSAATVFSNFVGSFKEDKALTTLKEKVSNGQTTTTTTNNTSSGLDLTSILGNLLNFTNNSRSANIGEVDSAPTRIDVTNLK
ncbi:MAG: hypothetical protein IJ115_08805 [Erysipelotrichaceae bacterium]|nr:hypothetical protein [Erysipelotrichaceae bacterium]